MLKEENQFFGSICSKEVVNQTELKESDMIFPQLNLNSWWTEERSLSVLAALQADCDVTLSSETSASSTSSSPRVPASTNRLIKYLCRESRVARLSSFMALTCFAFSLLASFDNCTTLLPDTWTEVTEQVVYLIPVVRTRTCSFCDWRSFGW